MALLPIKMSSTNATNHYWSRVGFFVKMKTFPGDFLTSLSGDVTLVDLDGGTTAYFRVKVGAHGIFTAEASYAGHSFACVANPSMTMYAGYWYWVSASFWTDGVGAMRLYAGAWGPGGTTDGQQNAGTSPTVHTQETVSCHLGWGVSLSSFYQPFPNEQGYQMDELIIDTGDDDFDPTSTNPYGIWVPPTGDIDPTLPTFGTLATHPLALYLCHEAAGSSSGLADSSGNGYNLSPGPQGLLVVGDGPY